MKALVSLTESRESGHRVVQVEPDSNVFEIAEGFVWVDCSDTTRANQHYYDQENQSFVEYTEPTPSVAVTPANPTKQQLLAEMEALSAKIAALG